MLLDTVDNLGGTVDLLVRMTSKFLSKCTMRILVSINANLEPKIEKNS